MMHRLRLVGAFSDAAPTPHCDKSFDNSEIARFLLTARGLIRSISRIVKSIPARRQDARGQVQDAQPESVMTVAKISPAGIPLVKVLNAWERECVILRKFDKYSVQRSRTRIERIARDCKWTTSDDIDRNQATAWLTDFVESGKAGKTAKNYALALGSLGKHLKKPGQPNPFEDLPSPRVIRAKGAAPFSADELGRLIETAQKCELSGRASLFGPLRETIYELLAHTGLRIGELRTQLREDVHLDEAILIVTKDKARRRDPIALNKRAVELIRAWLKVKPRGHRWNEAVGTGRLFPTIPSPKTLKRDMKRAGIPSSNAGKKGEWHRFRKSAVTLRRAAGGSLRDVSKFARHRETSTTEDLYDLPDVSELRSVAELIGKFPARGADRLTSGKKSPIVIPVTDRSKSMPLNSNTTRDFDPGRVGIASRSVTGTRRKNTRPGSNSRGSTKSPEASNAHSKMEPWGIEPPAESTTERVIALLDRLIQSQDSISAALLSLLPGVGGAHGLRGSEASAG